MCLTCKDPQRFTNLNERGEVYHSDPSIVETEIWHRVLDLNTKQPTGCVRRDGYRTVGDVYQDLNERLDWYECTHCGDRVPKPDCGFMALHDRTCRKCGTKEGLEPLIDEYFSIVHRAAGAEWPHAINGEHVGGRTIVWACTGGNEGWYWHVGVLLTPRYSGPTEYKDLLVGKTFRSMEHCQKMAAECAKLLGV